jgi:hypothetical protein
MPEHDDPSHRAPELGLVQQVAVGDDEIRSEVGTARHLGQQRGPQRTRHLLRALPRTGSGDDDRGNASAARVERDGRPRGVPDRGGSVRGDMGPAVRAQSIR